MDDPTRTLDRDATLDQASAVVVYVPDGPPRRHALGPATTIGRSETCDIVVANHSVSRRHAILHCSKGVFVEDLGGKNGVFVGGLRIAPGSRVPLSRGTVVEVGEVLIQLADGSDAELQPLPPSDFDGFGAPMVRLERLLPLVASGDVSVIFTGETGVGKDVHAEKMHRLSPRADKPFVAINCAALAEHLVESELFGHERGAFTGAVAAKVGLLESAQGGTVFLDEIGELPLALQAKLLRALEKREVIAVGSTRARQFDARFIAATHRDLEQAVRDGSFRMDLYYRLNGITLEIPPLRERKGEILELAMLFAEEAARRMTRDVRTFTPAAEAALLAHSFPGNVRELKNIVERAVLLCQSNAIDESDLHLRATQRDERGPSRRPPPDRPSMPSVPAPPMEAPQAVEAPADPTHQTPLSQDLRDFERGRIEDALTRALGNQTKAAGLLGISRRTLLYRMSVCGVDGSAFRTVDFARRGKPSAP